MGKGGRCSWGMGKLYWQGKPILEQPKISAFCKTVSLQNPRLWLRQRSNFSKSRHITLVYMDFLINLNSGRPDRDQVVWAWAKITCSRHPKWVPFRSVFWKTASPHSAMTRLALSVPWTFCFKAIEPGFLSIESLLKKQLISSRFGIDWQKFLSVRCSICAVANRHKTSKPLFFDEDELKYAYQSVHS